MIEKLAIVSIVVKDQDEALEFYTEKLGFYKVRDVRGPIRFLTVAPNKGNDTEILLQPPDPKIFGEEKANELLNQIGKMSWIFNVDDTKKTVEELRDKGVEIIQEPRDLGPYGSEAIIADLYGNTFMLREPPK